MTTDQNSTTGQNSQGQSGSGSQGEGFIGTQGSGSDEYLREDGKSSDSDFAKQGRGALDDQTGNDDDSGESGSTRGSSGGGSGGSGGSNGGGSF